MNSPDHELLRRFAAERSEPAFTELVERHVGLVYSAALRQVGGDTGAAEDVAQSVFADLARKAAHLTGHTSLTGWLYTSTRYLAANARREELRRRQREQEAHMMDRLHRTDDAPDWEELRPVLDEAMHELGDSDRAAVLLRFFQQRPLAEVGERLGIGENAARMRVDRALDRLRRLLARRGVTSTAAALGVALTERTLGEVPANLPRRISHAAIAGATTGGGLIFTLLTLMAHTKTKVLIAAAVAALLLAPVVRPWFAARTETASGAGLKAPAAVPAKTAVAATAATSPDGPNTVSILANDPTVRQIRLTLLTTDTGKPIPNVVVERERDTQGKFLSQRDGTVQVTYPKSSKELQLTTRLDGFADTRLRWSLERGETVPATYTLRLERAVPIGGTVVDADGKPVAGAKVGLNHEDDLATASRTENHEFGWIEVATDDQGRWRVNRFAADILPGLYGYASHPDHVPTLSVHVSRDPALEPALRAEKHVFHLRRAVTISGTVVDTEGNPVAGAKVRTGHVNDASARKGTSGVDGSFVLRGCMTGDELLSAEAKGYAATTEMVSLAADSAPFRLVVKPGSILRLRMLGQDGQPVPKAYAWLDTQVSGNAFPGEIKAAPVQTEVELISDADGRVVWEEAPDAELTFDIEAPGHLRLEEYKIHPDGQEHTVILPNTLTISGNVTDSQSGAAISKFRIISGWPEYNPGDGTTNAYWSTHERFWFTFAGGKFRQTFTESVVYAPKNPGFIFRFEADGYMPWVSRTVAQDEGDVRLDVALRPAKATMITLLQPDGQPAAQAAVALVVKDGDVLLSGTGFNPVSAGRCVLVHADRNGQFQLPDDNTTLQIVAVHAAGFAIASRSEFAGGQATWTLPPWGVIEGQWRSNGKPVAGREVLLYGTDQRSGPLRFDWATAKTRTDEAGNFLYQHVPPGRFRVARLQVNDVGNRPPNLKTSHSTEVEVRPGERTEVTLDGTGHHVAARIIWADGKPSLLPWRFFGAVYTPYGMPPTEVVKDPEALKRWWEVPEHQQAAKTKKEFPMVVRSDGTILAEDVEPGDYVVTLEAFVLDDQDQVRMRIRNEPIPLSIPDSAEPGVINLGAIALRTEAGAH